MKKHKHVSFSDCETLATDSNATPQKPAANRPFLLDSPSITESTHVKKALLKSSEPDHDAHLSPKKARCEPYFKSWTGEDGESSAVRLSPEVMSRLAESFDLHPDAFRPFLSVYAQYKFLSAMKGTHPYTVRREFYKLFKAVAGVSHELFADAINASGVLPNFCSINKDDLHFGAVGPWEDVESLVDGGVGHPPFSEKFLISLLRTVHQQVKSGRPYFRALILPYEEGTTVYELITDELLGAEIVAVISPEQQSNWFMHQLNYFKYDPHQYRGNEPFSSSVCIAVWINERYRRNYPPPSDVEECFQAWEHNQFGPISNIVDYVAVDNCFPERNRCGKTKVGEIEDDPLF